MGNAVVLTKKSHETKTQQKIKVHLKVTLFRLLIDHQLVMCVR